MTTTILARAMKGKSKPTTCAVCGARISGWRISGGGPRTCDNICTRAKRNLLTRGRQISQDIINAERDFNRTAHLDAGLYRRSKSPDYNRPYLASDFAGV